MSDGQSQRTALLPRHVQKVKRVGGGFAPKDKDGGDRTNRSKDGREAIQKTGFQIMNNNPRNQSIHSTMDVNRADVMSERSDRLKYLPRQDERDRKLSQVANSVSGFYGD